MVHDFQAVGCTWPPSQFSLYWVSWYWQVFQGLRFQCCKRNKEYQHCVQTSYMSILNIVQPIFSWPWLAPLLKCNVLNSLSILNEPSCYSCIDACNCLFWLAALFEAYLDLVFLKKSLAVLAVLQQLCGFWACITCTNFKEWKSQENYLSVTVSAQVGAFWQSTKKFWYPLDSFFPECNCVTYIR